MNKYKRAFNTIGDTITYYTICKDLASLPSDNEIFDSMATLMELVEKEKPKKPDYEGDGYSDGELVYDTWICPNCGKSYEVDYEEYERCPHCGQKLDGENEDER